MAMTAWSGMSLVPSRARRISTRSKRGDGPALPNGQQLHHGVELVPDPPVAKPEVLDGGRPRDLEGVRERVGELRESGPREALGLEEE